MFAKVLLTATPLGIAAAQYHQSNSGDGHGHGHGHDEEQHAPAHYAVDYSVNDPHSGDIKFQHETREGDVVQGSYSLSEADGTITRVEYTADHHSGFNAVVHREGHTQHSIPAHYQFARQ